MRTVLPTGSTTTIFSLRDYHDLKINGYRRSLDTDSCGLFFSSLPFRAGCRRWHIIYRPKGYDGNSDYISFFLALDDIIDEGGVLAKFTFSLLDQDKNPLPCYCITSRTYHFSVPGRMAGFEEFIKRTTLEASEHLKDDCFTVRVQIHVVKKTPSILVPPSDIQQHLGSLLSMEGADVRFQVGGEIFVAHRLVLAARSPVFNAELYSSMDEGIATNTVRIDDMEAQVFKAMLNFIYTDSWPEMEQEDESIMAQHLLVAADKYCMQRLKLICESRLQSHINAASVAIVLALAEKHNCTGLKEACFKFLRYSTDPLVITETEDFEYLAQSCPSVMEELNAICLARDLEMAEISQGINVPTSSNQCGAWFYTKVDRQSTSCFECRLRSSLLTTKLRTGSACSKENKVCMVVLHGSGFWVFWMFW
ncbi:hypothetical protein SORBI_3006G246700 [Sorghum bicolor]|uniref:BTB domain-containing protein n=1 Tax=Sorghum bicolor TaxID=4558 RepID=A0A1B6PNR3_SORBI|nr:hypothetical protein SORBI_3006G246700 [Sorghum bicolor]